MIYNIRLYTQITRRASETSRSGFRFSSIVHVTNTFVIFCPYFVNRVTETALNKFEGSRLWQIFIYDLVFALTARGLSVCPYIKLYFIVDWIFSIDFNKPWFLVKIDFRLSEVHNYIITFARIFIIPKEIVYGKLI